MRYYLFIDDDRYDQPDLDDHLAYLGRWGGTPGHFDSSTNLPSLMAGGQREADNMGKTLRLVDDNWRTVWEFKPEGVERPEPEDVVVRFTVYSGDLIEAVAHIPGDPQPDESASQRLCRVLQHYLYDEGAQLEGWFNVEASEGQASEARPLPVPDLTGKSMVFTYPVGFPDVAGHRAHSGQRVVVTGPGEDFEFHCADGDPLWNIEARGGWTGTAWQSELSEVEEETD